MKTNRLIPFTIALFSLVGCASGSDLKFVENKTIELGSDADSCSLIESVKGKAVSNSNIKNRVIEIDGHRVSCSEIDTSTIGNQKVYFDLDGKMSDITVKVVDTTPPEISILDNVDSTNPLDYVKAKDLSGVQSLKFEGTYDSNTPGEYTVEIVATDNEGNESRKELVLTVRGNKTEETEKTKEIEESKES